MPTVSTEIRFFRLYSKVFDADKNFRSCGRDTCIELIQLCNTIAPGRNFGNVETGMVVPEPVHWLYEKLLKNLRGEPLEPFVDKC